MNPLKKFLQMFAASMILFLILAAIDDYKALVLPFIMKEGKGRRVKTVYSDPTQNEDLKEFVKSFNSSLSQIYISSEPRSIATLPADESLKKSMKEDMEFLIKSGKIQRLTIGDIAIKEVKRLSPLAVRVTTKERVSLSYLNLSDRAVIMPERVAYYHMVYTLEMREQGLTVVGFETLGVEG